MRPSHLIGTLLSFIAIPALADAPPPGLPSRSQNGNVVMSSANPHLNISVSRSFTALPPLTFAADAGWIDRRLFVDARDGKVRRLIIVDFDQGGPADKAAETIRRWGTTPTTARRSASTSRRKRTMPPSHGRWRSSRAMVTTPARP